MANCKWRLVLAEAFRVPFKRQLKGASELEVLV